MALVIPSYVPLHRLPAASGLQLVFAGTFQIKVLFAFLAIYFDSHLLI